MAQLKDLIVTGPSRFLNDLYALTIYEGGVKLEDKYYLATNPSGYTSNAGTVTSVAASGSGGISISGSPITSSGTLSIGLDLSTAINGLTTGSSPSYAGDFLVSQYAGASQTSYHRRPVYLVAQGVLGYTTSGKNYAIVMDSSTHKLYVNVPWTDTTYSAGSGISISSGRSISVTNPVPIGTVDDSVLSWDNESGEPYWKAPTWITGSGTSGYLAKWNGTNSITNAAQYDTGATNGTIAQRTGQGYLFATYFNTTAEQVSPSNYTSSSVAFVDQNGWLRKSSKTMFINWINPDIQAYEAKLQWGGRNFAAAYGPIDAAMIGTLGANRFELLKPGTADNPGIEVFYSRDAGSTWIDYGLNNSQKRNIFNSTAGTYVTIGKRATSDTKSVDDRAKIVIHTGVASVYTSLNKFALYVTTSGSANCWVTIDKCIQNKDYSVESNWENVVTKVPISGWSGWNIINTNSITTYGNSPASQYGHLRFIFGADTAGSTSYVGLTSQIIAGFGGVGWSTPSNLAKYGHAYYWNSEGIATFQAGIIASGNVTADARNGTASTTGITYLTAGNAIFSGTDYNSRGALRLYGTGSGYANIFYDASDSTSPSYYLLPRPTNQYISSVNISGVINNSLAKFDSTTGHLVSLANGSNGQILAIVNGTLTWSGNINALLPSYSSSDRGKFLVVSEGEDAPAWEALYWSDISSTPTTLGGYGITDAKIQNGTITLGSNSITPVTGSSLTANEFIVGNDNSAIKTATVATIRTKLGLKQLAFVEATSPDDDGKYLKAVDDGDAIGYEWATPPTGMSNPMAYPNDIIVGGTNGAATRLGKGSNGTFLGINSSGNVAWVDNPIPFNGDNDGDVFLWNGTNETPEWMTPPWLENLIFNAGEIIIGSSNGDPMALSKGSTGQVLTTTSSGNRVAWQNATVRMNANTGSTALSVLLAPSDVSNGASKEAQYANTSGKQLKFTPSTGNLSGVAQINGSTVPSSPKFTDTTYTFASGTGSTNGFTVTPAGGSATTYTIGSLICNQDTRDTNTTPSTYYSSPNGALRFLGLKSNSTIGISTSVAGTYSGVLGLSPWSDSSGGHAWEFAFNQNGVYARHGASSWSSWAQVSFGSSSGYRPIQVSGTAIPATDTLNFIAGSNISISTQQSASTTRLVIDCTLVPCVIEGTLIRMADGTDKPVEELQNGDEILSWDPNSNKLCTAIVVCVRNTGKDKEFVTHIFDDGSYLTVYGEHVVYNKTKGYPIDIAKFEPGDETINVSGETIVYAGSIRHYCRYERKAHYDVNSSNNLYFAGGVLNGKMQFAKFRAMQDVGIKLSPEVQAIYEEHKAENEKDLGYEQNEEYIKQIASDFKQRSILAKAIEKAKKNLADSDYIVQKYTEGLISAIDWLKAKSDRAGWRKIVNDDETALAKFDTRINDAKNRFASRRSKKRSRYLQQCRIDNIHLEDYRAMFKKTED